MKRSDFQYNFIEHHVKQFSAYSNLGCCHGNTFFKSGSPVKNDQATLLMKILKTECLLNAQLPNTHACSSTAQEFCLNVLLWVVN